jgi:hypothetical protein
MPTNGHSSGTSTKLASAWYFRISGEYQRIPTFGSLYPHGHGATLFSSGGTLQGLTEGGRHARSEPSSRAPGHSVYRYHPGFPSAHLLRPGDAHAAPASRAAQRWERGPPGGVGMPYLRTTHPVAIPSFDQFLPRSPGCPARPSPPILHIVQTILRSPGCP